MTTDRYPLPRRDQSPLTMGLLYEVACVLDAHGIGPRSSNDNTRLLVALWRLLYEVGDQPTQGSPR